jgi:ATP-binding cassette subfamily F protein 3
VEDADNSSTKSTGRKQQKQQQAQHRQQLKPLKEALRKAEKSLEKLYQKQEQLETQLADNALYTDDQKTRLSKIIQDKHTLDMALESAEEDWLNAQSAIENTSLAL